MKAPLLSGRDESLDISRAVQNPDYLDAFGHLAVKNDVVPNRKAAHGWAKLVACPAHLRKATECLTVPIDCIEEAVCFGGTVVCDVIPDIE